MNNLILLSLSLIFISGCVTGSSTVKSKAAFDFDCSEEKIIVEHISGTSYGAKGCEKKAQYTCDKQAAPFGVKCVKD